MANVEAVVPYYSLTGTLTQGSQTTLVQIVGVDFSQLSSVFPSLSLATGSLPSSSDLQGAAVGYSVAYPDTSGASNLTVNAVAKISFSSFGGGFGGPAATTVSGDKSFIVTGIYNEYGTGFTISPDTALFVSLEEGEQIAHSEDYTGLIVVASGPSTVTQVTTEITAQYGTTVRTSTVSSILSTVTSVTSELGTILASVGGISVLVAFIGISTTMFTTVVEPHQGDRDPEGARLHQPERPLDLPDRGDRDGVPGRRDRGCPRGRPLILHHRVLQLGHLSGRRGRDQGRGRRHELRDPHAGDHA